VDVFAWTVVGSVAGVVAALAAIVFGLVPLMPRRNSQVSRMGKEADPAGSVSADNRVTGHDAVLARPGVTRSGGAIRVKQARPGELGVHAAIQVPGAIGDLPVYVARKADVLLREALLAGEAHGYLVLLVGGSSVGKTRLLFEAVRGQLGDWWLAQPADGEEVADAGEWHAGFRLAELLAESGRLQELRTRMASGDRNAAFWYASVLADQDRAEEAIIALRPFADLSDPAYHTSDARRRDKRLAPERRVAAASVSLMRP
jgi:hypothetical protein